MTLSCYLQGLLTHFTDARIVRNITRIVEKMVEHTSIRLWSISADTAEFTRNKRLVNGALNAVLDEDTVATALRDIGSREVTLSDDDAGAVVLLHDPSDIRKPYSTTLECLGTVRALNGQLVPGYQTFTTVAMDEHGSTPQPMDVSVYSNGDPDMSPKRNSPCIAVSSSQVPRRPPRRRSVPPVVKRFRSSWRMTAM